MVSGRFLRTNVDMENGYEVMDFRAPRKTAWLSTKKGQTPAKTLVILSKVE